MTAFSGRNWRDDDWRQLSRGAQALYMQLLSQKEVDCAVSPLWSLNGQRMSDVPEMNHGDAERMYDFMVLFGANPVPWQYELLRRFEQQSIDEKFRRYVTEWTTND